jgi:hypothetical protein
VVGGNRKEGASEDCVRAWTDGMVSKIEEWGPRQLMQVASGKLEKFANLPPLAAPKGAQPYRHLDFSSVRPSCDI